MPLTSINVQMDLWVRTECPEPEKRKHAEHPPRVFTAFAVLPIGLADLLFAGT